MTSIVNEFVYFTPCSKIVNHNNERERSESGALRHTATECLSVDLNSVVVTLIISIKGP